jgi:hypothetical protein
MIDASDRAGKGEAPSNTGEGEAPPPNPERAGWRRWWPSIPIAVAIVIGAIIAAAASGSGCGSGVREIRDHADGFSISVPACWQTKPPSYISKGTQALANTSLGGDASALNSVRRYFKLLVIDPNTTPHDNGGVGLVPGPFSTVNSDPELRSTIRQDIVAGQAGSGFVIHDGPLQMMSGVWYFAERETYPGRVKGMVVKPSNLYYFLAPNALYFLYVYGTSASEANTIAHSLRISAPS